MDITHSVLQLIMLASETLISVKWLSNKQMTPKNPAFS